MDEKKQEKTDDGKAFEELAKKLVKVPKKELEDVEKKRKDEKGDGRGKS